MIQSTLLQIARFIGGLRWLRRGLRERAIRLLRLLADAPDSMPFRVQLRGFEYEGTLGNVIDWNVYFYGIYEPDIVSLFEISASNSNRCVLDVGANVGHHSLLLSRMFRAVESFEPWPVVRVRLTNHLQRNNVQNVRLHDIALGDAAGKATFYVPPVQNLGQGSLVAGHVVPSGQENETVSVCVGDDYVRQAAIADPDLIKVDVEGYEGQVLRGLRATLERARPVLIFELSTTTKQHVRSLVELLSLLPSGYSLYETRSRSIVLWIFEKEQTKAVPLSFESHSGNVLAIPAERAPAFARVLAPS